MPRDTRDRESVPHPYPESVGRSGRSDDSSFRRRNDRDRHNKDEDRMTKRDNSYGSSSYREDRRRRSRSRSKSRSRSRSPPNRAKSSSANSSADVNSRFSMNSGIQMKLLTPAATSSPTVRNKSALPVPSSTSSSTASSNKLGTTKLKVASIFNDDDDDDEPEEMPAECRMRMKNVGRETPTSAGPNSFGKTKIGFCNVTHITEKKHNV